MGTHFIDVSPSICVFCDWASDSSVVDISLDDRRQLRQEEYEVSTEYGQTCRPGLSAVR